MANRRSDARAQVDVLLRDLTKEIEEAVTRLNRHPGSVGAKVWIQPERYYSSLVYDRRKRRALAEIFASTVGSPRLQLVGHVQGGEQGSSGRWPIGKGMVSHAMHSGEDYHTLVHQRDWSDALETLPRREFMRLPRAFVLGRSQAEFNRLRAKYGTALFFGLKPIGSPLPPFGCLTVHTPHSISLTVDEIRGAVQVVAGALDRISDMTQRSSGFSVPDAVTYVGKPHSSDLNPHQLNKKLEQLSERVAALESYRHTEETLH